MSNEIQALHQDATAALVTLDPETYVAAVYKPFSARLEAAIKETEGEKFDIQTTDGLDRAKKCRALFRSIRTEGENERKSRKAPIITIGRMLDSEYEKLKDQVVPHEDKFDAMVKAEEERKEAIKLAKIKREAEVDARIDAIRQLPLAAINMTSAQVQDEIERISQIVPTRDEFDDRDVEAETVINATITQLQSLMSGKKAQEAIAKQLEDQQREAARVDALKGKVQAIKNLILDSAECDTAEQMKALIQKAESEVIDDSYAEFKEEAEAAKQSVITSLGRQYAGLLHAETLAAEAEEAARAKLAAEAAKASQPAPIIDPSAPAIASIPEGHGITQDEIKKSIYVIDKAFGSDVKHADASARIKLGDINAALGFMVTADFLASIGWEPVAKERNSIMYREVDFQAICESLVEHIVAVAGSYDFKKAA